MELNKYQEYARRTAIYNKAYSVIYPALGLSGEAGEVANKAKKIIRNHDGVITDKLKQEIFDECSDCLWYIAAILTDLEMSMDDCAKYNIEKLSNREKTGEIKERK